MSELTGSNHRCRAQFKCVQTVVGQRLAGNGPNGLSNYYTTTITTTTTTTTTSTTTTTTTTTTTVACCCTTLTCCCNIATCTALL